MNSTLQTLHGHKSIRNYSSKEVSEQDLQTILEAAVRASNTGNMQLYSIIVNKDLKNKERLAPCHFGQAMLTEAPLVLTFVADIHRFHQWCEQREAGKAYDNFLWFLNAMTDALLAAQNAVIAAESLGMGICYLGTTLYNAKKIAQILNLPKGVVPVISFTLGYPAQDTPLTDRLPLEAIVHYESYQEYSSDKINALFAEKESSEQTKELLEINQLSNLAKIFTEKRYTRKDGISFSQALEEFLKEADFMNHE